MREIAAHIIEARARWFSPPLAESGDKFEAFGKWNSRGARPRSAEELVNGLEVTWIQNNRVSPGLVIKQENLVADP